MFGTPLGLGKDKEACFIPVSKGVTRPFELLEVNVLADERATSVGILWVLICFALLTIVIFFMLFCDDFLFTDARDLAVGMLEVTRLLIVDLTVWITADRIAGTFCVWICLGA